MALLDPYWTPIGRYNFSVVVSRVAAKHLHYESFANAIVAVQRAAVPTVSHQQPPAKVSAEPLLSRYLLVNLGKTGKTKNTVKSGKTVIQVEIGEV